MARPQGLTFVLVGVHRGPDEIDWGIRQWRATCGERNLDVWFFAETTDKAREHIRARYPGATFTDEPVIIRVQGANLTDQVFTITLRTGEVVTWNVTKLEAAAKAGVFGLPRYLPTADLPPADWTNWDAEDRAKVDYLKHDLVTLNEPAIVIESENPDFLFSCFADGQHRVTARQELKMRECAVYVVPLTMERAFRVEGLDAIDRIIEEGGTA